MRRLLYIFIPILLILGSCGIRTDLFHIASSDLRVYSCDPVNGGPDIPLNAKVTVAFTANMDTWTTKDAFSISFGGSTYTADDGWFEWFAGESAFVFHYDPDHSGGNDDDYPVGTEITVSIDTSARDQEGFYLTEQFEWSFTTSPVPFSDLTIPEVTVWAPSFSEQISPPDFVEIQFTEPMIASTVVHSFVLASTDWQDIRWLEHGHFQWYDNRMRFRYYPLNPLKTGKDYKVMFDYTNVRPWDRAGNQLDSADWNYTFPSQWQGSIRIVVDPLQVSEQLTDFPVYVDLSQVDSSFFDDIAPGGTDIFVFDDSRTKKLPRELVYTGPNEGELWFKAPKLYTDRDTVFYILYDSLLVDSNDTDVWSNGYLGVYHLHQSFDDSTIHAHTANDSGTSDQLTQIGRGRLFDAVGDDLIDIPFPDIVKRDGTVSLWICPNDWGVSDHRTIFDASLPPINPFFLDFQLEGPLRFRTSDFSGNPYEVTKDVSSFIPGSWHHLTGTWRYKADLGDTITAPAANMYFDGDFVGQSGGVLSTLPVLNSPFIGHTRADFETTGKFWGSIDEIHISDIRRTAGWVRTQYNNQNAPWVGAGGFFKEITLE
ncbi:MAG TPA: Ig-like domain-containing protein [Spirochaetota bacterium]|nr:Ig-like domain-containing protein [Spirochaetota bacterium]